MDNTKPSKAMTMGGALKGSSHMSVSDDVTWTHDPATGQYTPSTYSDKLRAMMLGAKPPKPGYQGAGSSGLVPLQRAFKK